MDLKINAIFLSANEKAILTQSAKYYEDVTSVVLICTLYKCTSPMDMMHSKIVQSVATSEMSLN